MADKPFDPGPVLRTLKDFQRRTVEHVFRRLYTDKTAGRRFLVADEVGLGKTLVARGVIAKAIKHLEADSAIDRIDIVYICSNGAIAQQNVNRLNVTGDRECALASRLTLLPLELADLGTRKLNFVSFTPGTTFDLKYSTGRWEERRLLYKVLRRKSSLDKRGLMNLLRCDVSRERWRERLQEKLTYDQSIIRDFLSRVGRDADLMSELQILCRRFRRASAASSVGVRKRRNESIGKLRRLLAKSCVEALEPDLIILDEFQRFKDLLGKDTEAGQLAHDLMEFRDARVLLLSATPYRMLSLYDEDEDSHYQDFIETLRFLYDDDARLKNVRQDLEEFRVALYSDPASATRVRDRLRYRLMRVMARTERVPETKERDAMVSEPGVYTEIQSQDICQARALDDVVRAVGAQDAMEYWKSAPYLINFMKDYELKRKLNDCRATHGTVVQALESAAPYLVNKNDIASYAELDTGNARLRALMDYALGKDEWKLIWMPPSLPYTAPGERFSGIDPITKSIVFSSWSVVPDVIAAVCSYAVERQRVLCRGEENYFELTDKRKALLTFRMSEGQPESMSTLLLLTPSPRLAVLVDPLKSAMASAGRTLTPAELLEQACSALCQVVSRLPGMRGGGDGRMDPAWYWTALGRLERRRSERFEDWCRSPHGWRSVQQVDADGGAETAFAAHVDRFSDSFDLTGNRGAVPEDLVQVLAEVAVGSPAVCAARALRRVAPDLDPDDPALLTAAAKIASGFRSLFNSPDIRSFLEAEEVPYWRQVLRYCIDGNLQAVLDEYLHFLKEALGLFDKPGEKVVREIAETVEAVLSIRTSNLTVDDFQTDGGYSFRTEQFKMRCKYALRFADLKDDQSNVLLRAGVVRDAFNSPFRPFILATTSIGQEGLDFHGYCHRIWHWNLPRNPVDMEQREGRVNRYKGHAIRKNVARAVGMQGLAQKWRHGSDPWAAMFDIVRQEQRSNGRNHSDLSPYWIYDDIDDPSRVERLVPLPPFSSEHSRLKMLKRNLAVYRLAFGQPRQQDLLDYLTSEKSGVDPVVLREAQLDLSPR